MDHAHGEMTVGLASEAMEEDGCTVRCDVMMSWQEVLVCTQGPTQTHPSRAPPYAH